MFTDFIFLQERNVNQVNEFFHPYSSQLSSSLKRFSSTTQVRQTRSHQQTLQRPFRRPRQKMKKVSCLIYAAWRTRIAEQQSFMRLIIELADCLEVQLHVRMAFREPIEPVQWSTWIICPLSWNFEYFVAWRHQRFGVLENFLAYVLPTSNFPDISYLNQKILDFIL